MQNVMFPQQSDEEKDVVAVMLSRIARGILLLTLGLSPLFFVPAVYAPFNFSKVMFVLVGVLAALIFYSFSVLRVGKLSLKVTAGLGSIWALAVVVFASAAFSGDVKDSLFGDAFGIHTAIFVLLLAFITWIVTILLDRKVSITRLYILLTGSGVVIGLYHILRLFFGPDTLTFGVFKTVTATPLGGWNDLALFAGLSLLLAMVAVEQFPLTRGGKILFGGVSAISLVILAVVNFFAIWLVLGLVSLIMVMYTLTKDRFKSNSLALEPEKSGKTMASIALSVVIFVCSLVFVLGGSGLGQYISTLTGVSYVEVRPSLEATINITRSVYQENALTGMGPNKFADAWRMYKDPTINQTIFWNSPFDAGVGFIPTFAVTAGALGIIAWLVFLAFLIRTGYKVIFSTNHVDRFWYFIGTSSFVSALYLWGMSIIYVPGPAVLMLAAVFTGVLYVAHGAMIPQRSVSVSLGGDRRSAFALVAVAMVVIVGSVTMLYVSGTHYSGLMSFNRAINSAQSGVPNEVVEQNILDAYSTSPNDLFMREVVLLQLPEMNSLLALSAPTESQKEKFKTLTTKAIEAGRLAVEDDPTNSLNWQTLGQIYSILTVVGIEGAYEQAVESFANASTYDPLNPEIKLMSAQLESRAGNLAGAKATALEAINLKSNYTDAFFFVSQIEIALGNVPGAIVSTLASIDLEPNNPARYYQLGVLYSSQGNPVAAVTAFENAVRLNESYANARYFLALGYDELNRPTEARAQLERVLELNPGNAGVLTLIEKLDAGERLSESEAIPEQVSEIIPDIEEGGAVTTPEDPGSPLLTPVNTVPEGTELIEDLSQEEVEEDQVPTDGEVLELDNEGEGDLDELQ